MTASRNMVATFTRGLPGDNVSADVLAAPAYIRYREHSLADTTYHVAGTAGAGDPVADTAAFNAATVAANADGRPVLARGTFFIRPGQTSIGNRWGQVTRPTYRGVELKSNVLYDLRGATIVPWKMASAPISTAVQFLFGTTINEADADTYENITFWEGTFDFRATEGFDNIVTNVPALLYAVGVTGCNGFIREGCRFINSTRSDYASDATANRGRALHIDNSYGMRLTNDRMSGITQGLYSHYVDNVTLSGGRLEGISEGYDFDGPSHDVTIHDLKGHDFVGTERDFIDFGGGKRWTVSNLFAKNLGAMMKVYRKSSEWLTWAQFLTAQASGVSGATQEQLDQIGLTEDITIAGLHGESVGIIAEGDDSDGELGGHGAIMCGQVRRAQTWSGPNAGSWDNTDLEVNGTPLIGPRRVRLYDVTLIDSAPIKVGDCEDFMGGGYTLINARSEDNSNDPWRNAALVVQQSQAGGSAAGIETDRVTRVTGFVDTVKVYNAQGSAVAITAPGNFTVTNLEVNGFNTLNSANSRGAVAIRKLGVKTGMVRLQNYSIIGGNSSSDSLFLFQATGYANWETATAYVIGDKRMQSNFTYICLTDHTSGTFATDLAAAKWAIYSAWDFKDFRVELMGRARLEPQNGALVINTQDRVGQRVYPVQQFTVTGGYDTTSATNLSSALYYQGREKFVVIGGNVIPYAAGSGSATDYTRIKVFKSVGGSDTELTTLGYLDMDAAAYVAGTAYGLNGTTTNSNTAVLDEGDAIKLQYVKNGSGSTFAGPMVVTLFGISYTSIGTA